MSQKTYAFCRNVALLDADYVTVDRWHLRACFGEGGSLQIGRVAYNQISELTKKKALAVRLKGYEYQAIVWESIRG